LICLLVDDSLMNLSIEVKVKGSRGLLSDDLSAKDVVDERSRQIVGWSSVLGPPLKKQRGVTTPTQKD
jgi:hypothetical protein